MKVYTPQELRRFLGAVDARLTRRAEVTVIGGAAAALKYGVATGTRDIDTWTSVQKGLSAAVVEAREATGLDVPFAQSGVADGPYEFESRLQRALPRLRRLTVMVPERHDLVLMKMIRGDEHDLQAIEAMHRRKRLQLSVLIERYQVEMQAAIIHPTRLRGHFLTMVERLFPRQLDRVTKTVATRIR